MKNQKLPYNVDRELSEDQQIALESIRLSVIMVLLSDYLGDRKEVTIPKEVWELYFESSFTMRIGTDQSVTLSLDIEPVQE